MTDYLKNKLQGAVDAIIVIHKDLDERFEVKSYVYYNNLSETIDVAVCWNSAFNIEREEQVEERKEFKDIQDFKKFCFDVWNFLDELEKEKYDDDYAPKRDRYFYEQEMRFEYNRGN